MCPNQPDSSDATARGGLEPITVPAATCQDYEVSSRLEWLETNGTGAFAMGTVSGALTRRYHGLLIASLHPPTDRFVVLSKIEEELLVDGAGQAVPLATNRYPGAIHPDGYRRIQSFRTDPFPTWTFAAGGVRIDKQIFLVRGEQTVVVRYRADRACALRVAPFIAMRDFHALGRADPAFDGHVEEIRAAGATRLRVRPHASLPALILHHNGGPLAEGGCWYYATEYAEEQARGFDFHEDLYRIGSFAFDLAPGRDAWVLATLHPAAWADAARIGALAAEEETRRRTTARDPLAARLERAADAFVVRRSDGSPTVLAGYPWFADWGRDTMIALPGLLLARGQFEEARDVLRSFLGQLSKGILPNRFPDRPGEATEYNTADATLWLFQAARAYLEATHDETFLRNELYPAARDIVRWHELGTHGDIHVDLGDGLLVAGNPDTQLTWMDARVDGRPVTSRHGKAVEINALWHGALRVAAAWAARLEPQAHAHYADAADRAQRSFEAAFWNAERGCLYDVIDEHGPDPRLRPNQIFALSLPHPLLSADQRASVLRAVETHLLTPVGLRTLAFGEPGYVGRYEGGPSQRDRAYHQGTVWPWLLGPYLDAVLNVRGRDPDTLAHCRAVAGAMKATLEARCLGSVPEIFDGDAPHESRGAPAQAWSVAELLRIWSSDLR